MRYDEEISWDKAGAHRSGGGSGGGAHGLRGHRGALLVHAHAAAAGGDGGGCPVAAVVAGSHAGAGAHLLLHGLPHGQPDGCRGAPAHDDGEASAAL